MRGRPADRCPDELLARSRRGVLSLVEQRALQAHLGVCGPCRAAIALGVLYDQIPDSVSDDDQADDQAVVARLAGRVTLHGRRRRERARPVAFAAGAVLMALAGAAAAWVVLQRPPAPPRTTEVRRASAGAPPSPPSTAPPPATPAPAPEILPLAVAPPAASKPAAGARHVRPATTDARSTTGGASDPSDDAGTLFASANAARGTGDLRTAARRYELLERRYPGSPEALVALVSAGDLLTRLDEPAAALEHFDRYLAANGRGPLASEALFGRARCLRALGRRPDELEAWRALIRRFPDSLYEATARSRVDELSR